MTNYPQKGRDQSHINPFQFRDLIYIFARNKDKTDRLQKVLLVNTSSYHSHTKCSQPFNLLLIYCYPLSTTYNTISLSSQTENL